MLPCAPIFMACIGLSISEAASCSARSLLSFFLFSRARRGDWLLFTQSITGQYFIQATVLLNAGISRLDYRKQLTGYPQQAADSEGHEQWCENAH